MSEPSCDDAMLLRSADASESAALDTPSPEPELVRVSFDREASPSRAGALPLPLPLCSSAILDESEKALMVEDQQP